MLTSRFHLHRYRAALAAGAGLLSLLCYAGCETPQGPAPATPPADLEARYSLGSLEFRLASDAGPTPLLLVADSLQYDPASQHVRALIAVRNDGTSALPGPQSIVVFGFAPGAVTPVNATCLVDSARGATVCAFDHRGTYGDDGSLSPGETSLPVEWILLDPGGEAFSFHATIGPREAGPGTIAGIVYVDLDQDHRRDPGEPGLGELSVRLRHSAGESTAGTDANGHYLFEVTGPGIYSLDLLPPAGYHSTTLLPLLVTIVQRPDGSLTSFAAADIGLASGELPAGVWVEGRVFEDANRNGVADPGEPGLSGVLLRGGPADDDSAVDDDDDHCGVRALSDSAGFYGMRLPAGGGPWEVRCESVHRFDRTTPKSVVFRTAPPSGEPLHADFGFVREEEWPHYEVKGAVFLDGNRNGVRDPSEVGLAGVLVRVAGHECALIPPATDRTNSSGRYEIDGEDVGCGLPWLVTRDEILGYDSTTPATVHIDAPPGGTEDTFRVDFGVAPIVVQPQ